MGSLSDDELEYLAPDFDPYSLTIPKLREILVQHDIQYSSSAKKSQLVEIFTEQLKPRARKILAARDRIRRTSKGIIDMPSSTESTQDDNIADPRSASAMPPPRSKTPGRRSARSSEDPSKEVPSTVKKTPSRKSSSKKLKSADTDESEVDRTKSVARKSRRSEITPPIKIEEPERPVRRSELEGSNFTDDNPFQSGSSPMDEDSRRRVSSHKSSDKRKSASSSRRRTVDENSERRIKREGTSTTFEMPVSKLQQPGFKREETLEPGEEFTVEEQRELSQEGAATGELSVSRPKKKNKSKRASAVPKSAPWIVLTTLFAGLAAWYRKEKLEIGYCGIGKQVGVLQEMELPEWAGFVQPQCEPCPLHALCYANLETHCEPDFMLQHHPLSLNGLIPIPPTCEPDSEKLRKVQAVATKAVEELRDRRAKWECGELTEENGSPASLVEIDEPKLKAEVSKKRRRGMTETEFEELWKGAVGEIVAREEVSSDGDGFTRPLRLSSSSLARISFGCAVRRSVRQTLARYRIQAGSLILLISLIFYGRNRIRTLQSDKARVPALVSSTLDRLATQAALHAQGASPEAFISMSQMRDDVLRDEFSIKRRDDIWNRVKQVVEMNANVRASVRGGRSGEVSRVWEWIGNLPVLDSGMDGDRRQSGRYSLGPGSGSLERTGSPMPVSAKTEETVEQRKWDEGRPIY